MDRAAKIYSDWQELNVTTGKYVGITSTSILTNTTDTDDAVY